MQNARNQNARGLAPEENDVLAYLHAIKAAADVIARAPRGGIVGKLLTAILQIVNVTGGLRLAPCAQRIHADAQQVGFGKAGEAERRHVLTMRGEMKHVSDAREGIALGDAAGVALIDGSAQACKFRLVLLFLALQCAQRRTDHFTGVLVASAFHFRQDKVVQLVS